VVCGIFADFDVGWATPPHVPHVWVYLYQERKSSKLNLVALFLFSQSKIYFADFDVRYLEKRIADFFQNGNK